MSNAIDELLDRAYNKIDQWDDYEFREVCRERLPQIAADYAKLANLATERDAKIVKLCKQLNHTVPATDFINLQAENADLKRKYEEEYAIVDKVWKALGITSYEQANGKTIWEIVTDLKRQVEELKTAEWYKSLTVDEKAAANFYADIESIRKERDQLKAKLDEIKKIANTHLDCSECAAPYDILQVLEGAKP